MEIILDLIKMGLNYYDVSFLGISESTVVHEFAALWLSYMSNDYSSKVIIYEQNGLEPLIRCLSEDDPDVQKNAIDTIALMLQVNKLPDV